MNGVRGLLQSIFETDPLAPKAQRTRAGSDDQRQHKRSTGADVQRSKPRRTRPQTDKQRTDDITSKEEEYVPKRFEGEYNVWFRRKPLGVGLVPSTQLYGAWEISSIQNCEDTSSANSDAGQDERRAISRGDVVIAVNLSCHKAQLSRAHFAAYLRRCACPIVMTLRKPEIYGSFDSRALSTAMYPSSVEYDRQHLATKVVARAPSKQWKRSMQHDLALNAYAARHDAARKLAQGLANSEDHGARQLDTAAGVAAVLEMREHNLSDVVTMVGTKGEGGESEEVGETGPSMSPLGEFAVTFDQTPLHLVLAPSTRLYGSVEVYDPKQHAPTVQVGDVIMAVNGDPSVSRLPSEDLIDFIGELHAPITLFFRRPVVYRNYLTAFFHEGREVSSNSMAHAMFPPSAEYKKRLALKLPQTRRDHKDSADDPLSQTESPAALALARAAVEAGKGASEGDDNPLNEWRDFAAKIGELDRFKMWQGNAKHTGRLVAGQQSTILTERHVHFLLKHLPKFLSCNQMELVYATRVHGWNLLSFFSILESKGPTIVVVHDTQDNIFGAFCSASWKRSAKVYGNGRSFVFSLRPHMRAYKWSGLDNSFMYAHREAIFVGGGKKGIALCLQLDDMRGFTKPCATFDSPPLSECESFRCQTVEVWGFSGLKV